MQQDYDLVVIGTGSAGTTAAYHCRDAGWNVAIIDSRPFGGTCALRGCDPKKVLVGAAEAVDWIRRMDGKGVNARGAGIDWADLMRFKRSFTEPIPEKTARSLDSAGIAAFHGRASFAGPNMIRVGGQQLNARHCLIATGAAPARLNLPGEDYLFDSTRFMEMDTLPRRIVFVGGGYISFEFAHLSRRAGAEVTILHKGTRPLAGFEPGLVDQLTATTRELGIDLRLNTAVRSISKNGEKLTVHAVEGSTEREFECDLAVHGAGRKPEIGDLNLEVGGVESEAGGVKVNEYLQSVSNAAVYAAGDCAALPVPRLTPVSGMEGEVAGVNLLKGNQRKPDFTEVPSVVFTGPPLAAVGLTEETAKGKGLKFRTRVEDTSGWYSSRRVGVVRSGSKVLIEEGTNRILGAHLFGPQAEEVINLFAIAIRFKLTTGDLEQMLFAYPTGASDIEHMI